MTTEKYRVLVTGSRTWDDARVIFADLDALRAEHGDRLVVVHGACPKGADTIASAWCRRTKTPEERHPADWNRFDKAAGPIRNVEMVDSQPDECRAYIRDDSRGASHCTDAALKAQIPTVVRVWRTK